MSSRVLMLNLIVMVSVSLQFSSLSLGSVVGFFGGKVVLRLGSLKQRNHPRHLRFNQPRDNGVSVGI